MGISDQDIDVDLPRALVGGIKRDAVEDLLRQIARDYRRLEEENARLWQMLEGLEQRSKESRLGERSVTGPGDKTTLEHKLLTPKPGRSQSMPSRHEPEDMSAVVLSLAQRAARELRESTRDECELMLKKARVQADRIERELLTSVADLEEILALRSELCDQLRSSLNSLLRAFVTENHRDLSAVAAV